ncbi:helix-turn-helix domain-containing protein, partial [Collinsella sp. AGMB00827]
MRTKADFRAVREFIGLSQQDIANDLGISAITPRRWESPSSNEPPEFAWEYLEDQLKRFYEIASYAIMQVTEAEHKPETVVFTLYRSQEQYDEFGRDPG